jgi:hypothetical protein
MSVESFTILAVTAFLAVGSVAFGAMVRRSSFDWQDLGGLPGFIAATLSGIRSLVGRRGRPFDDATRGGLVVPLDRRGGPTAPGWLGQSQPATVHVAATGLSPAVRADLGSIKGLPFDPGEHASRLAWRNAAIAAVVVLGLAMAAPLFPKGQSVVLSAVTGGLPQQAADVLGPIEPKVADIFLPDTKASPEPSPSPSATPPAGGATPGVATPGGSTPRPTASPPLIGGPPADASPTPTPTGVPTAPPTLPPTESPTLPPSDPPSHPPTLPPSDPPSDPPTLPPNDPPSDPPTLPPSDPPSDPPTLPPSDPPSDPPTLPSSDAPTDIAASIVPILDATPTDPLP